MPTFAYSQAHTHTFLFLANYDSVDILRSFVQCGRENKYNFKGQESGDEGWKQLFKASGRGIDIFTQLRSLQ